MNIGKKASYITYVGKREQPETCEDGTLLRDVANLQSLKRFRFLYHPRKIERIEMIDVVWLSESQDNIECVFEVENSTGFTSAIVRGSNIEKDKPKFMIIPVSREKELKSVTDPLFLSSFHENNWRYIIYENITRLMAHSSPSLDELKKISKTL